MSIVSDRLLTHFPMIDYETYGIPHSAEAAMYLAENDPFKFEEWAVSRIGGMHSGKYRNDHGIDGTFFYLTEADEKSRGIVSVKGGRSLNPSMIRDLAGTLERERRQTKDGNAIAVFVCAHEPTKGMVQEARSAGTVDTFTGPIPAVQILSVKDVFEGETIRVPAIYDSVSAAAAGRSRGKSTVGFVDPRELARQRQFFFEIAGGQKNNSQVRLPIDLPKQVMPDRVTNAA